MHAHCNTTHVHGTTPCRDRPTTLHWYVQQQTAHSITQALFVFDTAHRLKRNEPFFAIAFAGSDATHTPNPMTPPTCRGYGNKAHYADDHCHSDKHNCHLCLHRASGYILLEPACVVHVSAGAVSVPYLVFFFVEFVDVLAPTFPLLVAARGGREEQSENAACLSSQCLVASVCYLCLSFFATTFTVLYHLDFTSEAQAQGLPGVRCSVVCWHIIHRHLHGVLWRCSAWQTCLRILLCSVCRPLFSLRSLRPFCRCPFCRHL